MCLSNEQLYSHNVEVSVALNVIRRQTKYRVSSLSCLVNASPWLRCPIILEFPRRTLLSRQYVEPHELFYQLRKTPGTEQEFRETPFVAATVILFLNEHTALTATRRSRSDCFTSSCVQVELTN